MVLHASSIRAVGGDYSTISAWEAATDYSLTDIQDWTVSGIVGSFNPGDPIQDSATATKTAIVRWHDITSGELYVSDVVGTWAITDSFEDSTTGTNTGTIDALNGDPGTWIEKGELANEIYNEGATIIIGDATTDETHFRRLSGDQVKHNGTWAGRTATITETLRVLNIMNENYVECEWFAVGVTTAVGGNNNRGITPSSVTSTPGSHFSKYRYLIIHHADQSSTSAVSFSWGLTAGDFSNGLIAQNCVVSGRFGDGFIDRGSPRDAVWEYCVGHNCINTGILDGVPLNSIAFGNLGQGFLNSRAGSDYCAADDTSAPGIHSVQSILNPFVDAANGDFHLSSDATDVSAKGTATATAIDDIDGDIRSLTTPDIGVDEFIAAGGLTALLLAATADADAFDVVANLQAALDALLLAATADADAFDVVANLQAALAALLLTATADADAFDVVASVGSLTALLLAATADADAFEVVANLQAALDALLLAATADADAFEVVANLQAALAALLLAATADADAFDVVASVGSLTALLLAATADTDAFDVVASVGSLTALLLAATADADAFEVVANLQAALAALLLAATADADAFDVVANLQAALAALLLAATADADAFEVVANLQAALDALLLAATADADAFDVVANLQAALAALLLAATADADAFEVSASLQTALAALLFSATADADAFDVVANLQAALAALLQTATVITDGANVSANPQAALSALLETGLIEVDVFEVVAGELVRVVGKLRVTANIVVPFSLGRFSV